MEYPARGSCHLNLIPNRFIAHHCILRFYHSDGFFTGELAHRYLEKAHHLNRCRNCQLVVPCSGDWETDNKIQISYANRANRNLKDRLVLQDGQNTDKLNICIYILARCLRSLVKLPSRGRLRCPQLACS